jgi:hypothetical protein
MIRDANFNLEYTKLIVGGKNNFLEFSITWKTRNGMTNDQIRIFVPFKYENEIHGILRYFNVIGVKTY